jgi:hypothetical protein
LSATILPLSFGILFLIAEGEEWRPMITKCEKECGGDPSVWKYDVCVSACLMPWRNLQDKPDKFGPGLNPFSGGFPSPTWALPSNPPGETQIVQFKGRDSTRFNLKKNTCLRFNVLLYKNSCVENVSFKNSK